MELRTKMSANDTKKATTNQRNQRGRPRKWAGALGQQRIDWGGKDKRLDEHYREQIGAKAESTVWMVFINLGGLPLNNSHIKNTEVQYFMSINGIDIMGMAETNVNWYQLPEEQHYVRGSQPGGKVSTS